MDVDKWFDFLTRFGGQTTLLLALLWFLYKAVWPTVIKRIESSEAARERELEKFEAALRMTNQVHAEAVQVIVLELRSLKEEVIRKR